MNVVSSGQVSGDLTCCPLPEKDFSHVTVRSLKMLVCSEQPQPSVAHPRGTHAQVALGAHRTWV